MRLILASQSAGRRTLLAQAGVPHEAMAPGVDEDAAKAGLRDLSPRDLADALAELKAVKLSARFPDALVLGCDSVVALPEGRVLDKARDPAEAADHLRAMSGQVHHLWSAAVLARGGRPVWRVVDRAAMHVRPLTEGFIADYLGREWDQARFCVGVYRIEGPGAQLFTRIEGSHFTVIGLPLLPLLGQLRRLGVLPS